VITDHLPGVSVAIDRLIATISADRDRSFAFVQRLCRDHAPSILDLLVHHGAVLFRGFEIESREQYLSLLRDMGHEEARGPQMENKVPSPQKPVTPPRRDMAKLVPHDDVSMQGPHTELGWRSFRPRFVSFWCELPAAVGSETAVFDMARVYRELRTDLRDAFDSHLSNYYSQGKVTFFSEDFRVDSVLVHPETGRRCLVIWYFRQPLSPFAVEAYLATGRGSRAPLPPIAYEGRPKFMRVDPERLEHRLIDSTGSTMIFNDDQKRSLMATLYECAMYVKWQSSDLMIIDNILTAHARMQSVLPRKLWAAVWDEVDVRAFSANTQLAADECPRWRDAIIHPDPGLLDLP